MATLINGDGNAAVYAAQDSDWFAGVEGNTTKILKVGAKMEYEIEDANTIAIKNGVLVTKEGRRVQIDAGAIDEFIIPTGTQGVTRYFIIGYHLYTDASSNQLCETFVQLMANGTDTIPEDTFRGGSTDVYVSLYRVKQDGITLDTIQSLLPEGVDLDGIDDDITDIKADIDQINSDLTELRTDVDDQRIVQGIPANFPFTVPKNGFIYVRSGATCNLSYNQSYASLAVNGLTVYYHYHAINLQLISGQYLTTMQSGIIPVKKGDVVTSNTSGYANIYESLFYSN